MRNFIKFTAFLLSVLFALIFIFIESFEAEINKKADFKLKTYTKYLVLGHSHPECAFNDSFITHLKNLSESAESYYYTYFKAKKVIEQNPSIETVFIEFTNNQINESMNDWIWEEAYIDYGYPKYAPFMNSSDKKVLIKNNLSGFLNSSSLSFKNNFSHILNHNFSYSNSIGGYLSLKTNKTDSLLGCMKTNVFEEKAIPLSEINLNYLSKLLRFCQEQGKNAILIRSPQHKKHSGYSNESTYQQIRNSRYSSIEYLDFSKFPLNNAEFGDLEHLNYKGAKIFSIWFDHLLNKGLLKQKDKHEYINKEIKARMRNNI